MATHRACTGPHLSPRGHLTAGYTQGLHEALLVTPGTPHCWLHTGPAWGFTCYPGDISLLASHRVCTGPHLLTWVHLTAGYTQGLHESSLVTTTTSHCWLHTGPARDFTCHPGDISLLATHRACMRPCLLPPVPLTAGYTQGLHGTSLVTPGTSHCWLHTGPARGLACYPRYPSLLATHRACMGPHLLPWVHLTAGYTQGLLPQVVELIIEVRR